MSEPSIPKKASRFTPEAELVLCATRVGESGPLDELLTESLDWERIVQHAHSHGVVPALYRTLPQRSTRVPDDVLDHFEEQCNQITKWNLQATKELLTVIESLEAAGIDVIPYRGPVLASEAYDAIELRQFTDLDILLRREDIQSAKAVLADEGYRAKYERAETDQLSRCQEWAYTHFTRDYPFCHLNRQATVELHWRVLELYFPTRISLETVWNRRETTTIAGRELQTLSPEDRLLMTCVHGSKHHWPRLMWISDIDRVIRGSAIDWESTVERARKHNALRLFLLGPALVHELYGTEVPDSVHRLVAKDDVLDELLWGVIDNLFDTEPLDPLNMYFFQRKSLTRFQDQLRLLLGEFLTPRRLEIELVDLPFPLIWLYFLIRPCRAIGVRFGVISD